jgi:hypothetical protein
LASRKLPGFEAMNKPDLKSYSILRAYKMPAADNNPYIPIAAGKLAKVMIFAAQVSPAEYYGLSIEYGGGVLNEKEIQAIAQQAGLVE